VVTRGRVVAGETLLVVGTGGVGLQAVQIARAAGARVLATDVDPRKLERAEQCGAIATHIADSETGAWVRDATDGSGADVVIETAGRAEALGLASAAVRVGGRVVMVGYTVGATFPFPSAETVLGEVSYIGSRYVQRDELARAIGLVASGVVRPVVDSVLDLEDANEAFSRLSRGEAAGRIVLRVAKGRTV
jgi:D-arabinose 1-dehydrogenase-like Zn-dependent alcohol dehydrogenase